MSIAIIDYGSGNLHSAAKAFQRAVQDAGLGKDDRASTSDPKRFAAPAEIVLPGVGPSRIAGGAFAPCPG